MRKGYLKDGRPFIGIKIEHFVTKTIFIKAIASYCWSSNIEFDSKASKKDVMVIIKRQLFFQGIEGLYMDHWDGASEEFIAPFRNAWLAALKWVETNYPYLK